MVVRSGILKHTIPVAINEQPVVLNQDMKAIRPVGVSAKFLLRWVQGLNAQLLLAWSKPGATVESIEHEQLAGAIVPVPPDSEQVAINAFLDRETAKIDALIAEQERLLALLAEKRQATITHAVTRGLSPDAFMKDSSIRWLGQVPAHWDVMPLKRIVAVPITDGPHETPAFVDEGIPFVSAEAVSGGSIDFTKARGYISVADHEKYSGKYRPRLHDIFLVKSGATTGVSAIVESNVEFNIWSPLAVIRCDRRIADPYFVLAALRSRSFQQGLVLHWSYGTQQNIGMGVLGDLPVALPPLHEQKLIAAALAEQGRQHEELSLMGQRAIDLLRERRAALISAAVTGKIDVRTATEVVLA
jgi:type I restriction enzyme S subunit